MSGEVPERTVLAGALRGQPAAAGVAGPGAGSAPAETVMRALGCVALVVAAGCALWLLKIGGSDHPLALSLALAICGGLCLASLECGPGLIRLPLPEAATTAASSAIVSSPVLAIYWLQFYFIPASLVLAVLAAAVAGLRFGPRVPLTVMAVAVLHPLLAVGMSLVDFPVIIREDGAPPSPSLWSLRAYCLALISLLALASVIQMRRAIAPTV